MPTCLYVYLQKICSTFNCRVFLYFVSTFTKINDLRTAFFYRVVKWLFIFLFNLIWLNLKAALVVDNVPRSFTYKENNKIKCKICLSQVIVLYSKSYLITEVVDKNILLPKVRIICQCLGLQQEVHDPYVSSKVVLQAAKVLLMIFLMF